MVSIKKKLVYLIVVCVFLTAIILGGIGLFKVTSVINQNSQSSLNLVGSAEKQRLNVIFSNLKQSVDSLDAITRSRITDLREVIQDESYRNELTKELEYLGYALASNTNGAVSCYMRYNPELFNSTEGFFLMKSNSIQEFMPQECTDISKFNPHDINRVGWYYIPVNNHAPTWLVPYWNQNVELYIVSYVVPIYIKNVLVGIVGMDIDFSYIMREINEINPYSHGYAYLLDQDGTVVYHKNYEFGSAVEKDSSILEESFLLVNGWNLMVCVPKKDIEYEKTQIIPFMIIATLIVGLVFIILAIYNISYVINPLLELNEAVKKISAGNIDINITFKSNDEIGMLAENFRKAIRILPEYIYKDALTGIRNVSAYKKNVSEYEAKIAANEISEFGIVVLDVNNLKTTNDKYGHEAGNKLIVTAARYICRIFMFSPVFRIGGDEFVAILQKKDYINRDNLLKQFDSEMSKEKISVAGKELTLSIARGIGVYDVGSNDTYTTVFKRADDAMYENKKKVKEQMKQL